jgi:integrase
MPKLTKATIDSHSPKQKNYFIWDTEIKGFGCQILRGGKKTYAFYYHSPITRRKSYIKIGCHGNITVDFARNRAKILSAAVASGIDPSEQKKENLIAQRQSIFFVDFFEIFKERHITKAYKGKGAYNNISISRLHILPYFREKKLEEISSKDIRQFLDSLAHIARTANLCVSLMGVAFQKAEEWGYLLPHSNPCIGVRKYKDNKKQRFLSDLELAKLEATLAQHEITHPSSICSVNAIRLLLYIGCRKGEVLNLKWENVHIKDDFVYLDDTKTGESARPLHPKAVTLLASWQPKEGNPYIFYGKVSGKPLTDVKTAWRTILKKAGIKDFRIHDLRHSYASFALKKGVDLYTVSKLLGHKNIATTTRYAHLELESLKKATNKVAEVFGKNHQLD